MRRRREREWGVVIRPDNLNSRAEQQRLSESEGEVVGEPAERLQNNGTKGPKIVLSSHLKRVGNMARAMRSEGATATPSVASQRL
jgi:hypothetical protein